MLKAKSKYAWEGWNSSGNEDWVFSVKHPCELIGVHAKLIDKELKESEKIEYCVYSPRVSSTSTPFGLKSEEASRGICVTDKRFIISEDRHIEGMGPKLTSIDFADIQYFNIGNALILGWFSIHYCMGGDSKDITILFSSTGRHHFEKLIRSYKKYHGEYRLNEYGIETHSPSSFIFNIKDNVHRDDLKTLISSGERCALTFSCQYLWGIVKRKRWLWSGRDTVYLKNSATFLLTNKGLLIARNGVDNSSRLAVDVLGISLCKIKEILIANKKCAEGEIYNLKIIFSNACAAANLPLSIVINDMNTEVVLKKVMSVIVDLKEKEAV